jgi:glucose-1-phosphate adenylyltransferase
MNNTLTIIMAGGEGTRLSILSDRRAKPAVPFGGIYRIIDFTLSNVMHSGGHNVGIITQYRPYSLVDHVGLGEAWGLSGFGRMVKILSPHTGDKFANFYQGTADAIFRNIEFIERFPNASEVLILSADHIYQMDYRPMLALHRQRGAQLTMATQEVPWEETSRFGIMVHDAEGRIVQFQEKPKSNPLSNKASLGIYIFNRAFLIKVLREDQADPTSSHDFGKDIIPKLIHTAKVYNYDFNGYWRDVGTIRSYVETSMEALDPNSGLDLDGWGLRTNLKEIPLHCQHPMVVAAGGSIKRSLVSKGSVIEGEVEDSILSPGVRVGRGAKVKRSILLHQARVEEGCVLEDVIVDKYGVVGKGTRIGDASLGDQPNSYVAHLLDQGTSVIGKGAHVPPGIRMGRNCLVFPGVKVQKAPGEVIPSGSTFFKPED